MIIFAKRFENGGSPRYKEGRIIEKPIKMSDKPIIKKAEQGLKNQFETVVTLIQRTRCEVMRVANTALIDLYWQIGNYISQKIAAAEWGDSVVQQLADYIANNYPEIKGFSDKNLWRMKQFYETYRNADEKLSTLLREISWSNNLTIMSRTKTESERKFYIEKCIGERLSFRELNRLIDTAMYERSVLAEPKLSTVLRQIVPSRQETIAEEDA